MGDDVSFRGDLHGGRSARLGCAAIFSGLTVMFARSRCMPLMTTRSSGLSPPCISRRPFRKDTQTFDPSLGDDEDWAARCWVLDGYTLFINPGLDDEDLPFSLVGHESPAP